eukprot:m.54001 g.54001  ORF g.54001 m.54001 type:complete len:416 (+) comp13598_c0_seq2:60-1307(+)
MAKRTAAEADHGTGNVVFTVPEEFQELGKRLVRAVYSDNPAVIVLMDAIINHGCVKDADKEALIALDSKCLKEAVAKLRYERLIKSKEMDDPHAPPEARIRKASFLYVDYRSLINVVKYKLKKLHVLLEKEAKDARNSSNHECPNCKRSYTDMDFMDLLGPDGMFWCPHCPSQQLVDKADQDAADRVTALIKTLNQQATVFEKYLKKADSIVLSETLLQPKPPRHNLATVREAYMNKPRAKRVKNKKPTSSKMTSAARYNPFEEKVSINFTEDAESKEVVKAQPAWLASSTVIEGAPQPPTQATAAELSTATAGDAPITDSTQQLMADLAALDKANATTEAQTAVEENDDDEDDDDDDSDDDDSDDDEWEDAGAAPRVQVAGEWVNLADVDEDMTLSMTGEEFDTYSQLLAKHAA